MYREHCYAHKGKQIIGYVNGRKYRRVSIVAAKMGKNILAPLQYEGTMDSALFELWFQSCLIPTLPKNAVLVMDNAAFHRKSKLYTLAEDAGHTLIFLPPYSPDLNPIENFWAWLKKTLRKTIKDFDDFDTALQYAFQVVCLYYMPMEVFRISNANIFLSVSTYVQYITDCIVTTCYFKLHKNK